MSESAGHYIPSKGEQSVEKLATLQRKLAALTATLAENEALLKRHFQGEWNEHYAEIDDTIAFLKLKRWFLEMRLKMLKPKAR